MRLFEWGMLSVAAGLLLATIGAGSGSRSAPGPLLLAAVAVAALTVLTVFSWTARLRHASPPAPRRR